MNLSKTKQQAMDLLKSKWSHLYTFGYPTEPFPTSYKRDLDMVMLGICSEEIEDEKIIFAVKVLDSVNNNLNKIEKRLSINSSSIELGKIAGIRFSQEELRRAKNDLILQLSKPTEIKEHE